MKIRHKPSYGIDEIYMPGDPDPDGEPAKKPYLVFKLPIPVKGDERKYLYGNLTELLNLGNETEVNGKRVITITSNRKVISAIDFILKDKHYSKICR